MALIAWPPLGVVAGGLVGHLTGCVSYAATCPAGGDMLEWLVQLPVLVALLLLPAIARPAAIGSILLALASVPAGMVLAVAGGSRDPSGVAAGLLLAIIVMAYAVGIVGAVTDRIQFPPRFFGSG
ncbi:MAG TPA: hypothetical protein VNF73_17690 [Candidatus Saccharimonadales bacterium]|nr:hypothetical protein [Candidatus Saccharimonadales bacterium]